MFQVKTVKDAEKAINRLALRTQKFVVGLAPANNIYQFGCTPATNNVLFRYMFAAEGKVTRVIVYCPRASKENVIEVQVELSGLSGRYQNLRLAKAQSILEVEYPVLVGDRLLVSTNYTEPAEFDIAAIFVPEITLGERLKTKVAQIEEVLNERICLPE